MQSRWSIPKNEMEAKHANIVMTGENILKQFQTSDLGSRGYPLRVVYTIFRDGSIWKQVAPLTEFQREFIRALGLPGPNNLHRTR